jgi:osmotically-inducible protein OsmY
METGGATSTMTSISEDMTVQNDDTHTATSELKAAARDVLRVGKQWAHAAQEWFDDRRNEMNNRNRDEREFEGGRTPQDRNYESGYRSRQYQTGGAYEVRGGHAHDEHGNRGRGRSDYDIQSDYSGGGYDPLSAGQDLNAQRSYLGSASEQSDYLERGAYGREDRYAQGRSTSSDDYYGQRGYQGSGMQSDPRGMHGERNPQNAGYAQSQGREYATYSSQGTQPYQRGAERGQYQEAQRYDTDYPQYGRGGSATAQGRNYGSQEYGAQAPGTHGGYPQGDYETRWSGQRTQALHDYGTSGLEGARTTTGRGPTAMGYRGRGPLNYTRSDERIREDLNERLTDADDLDASGITVEVSNGVATLSGSVEERWMKHRAEDLADSCSGVRDVHNQIQVKSSMQRNASTSGTSAYPGTSGASTAGTTPGDGGAQSTRTPGTTGTSRTKFT